MIDLQNYKTYIEQSESIIAGETTLEDVLTDEGYAWSRYLCEASRLCNFGISGSAFRDWMAGLFRSGVLLYCHNYHNGIKFCEDPTAKLRPGIQKSCTNGNPQPTPTNGRLLHINSAPVHLQEKMRKIAQEILRDAACIVLDKASLVKMEAEENTRKAKEREDAMLSAWEKYEV